jgi:hypothetical protein
MVVFASTGVVLVLSLFGVQPISYSPDRPDKSEQGKRYEIPANIHAGDPIKQLLLTLLPRSPTLRGQCARITAAPRVRIVIELTLRPLGSLTRALSTARRYDSGLLTVVIELRTTEIGEFPELLAHEFEHVIELIEQKDLTAMAQVRSAGVTQGLDGAFETDRAVAAGRAAAAEAANETDPAAAAIGRSFAKVGHLAWWGLTGVRSTPHPPAQKRPPLPRGDGPP